MTDTADRSRQARNSRALPRVVGPTVCPVPHKGRYPSWNTALIAAERDTDLRPYRCVCGEIHLTGHRANEGSRNGRRRKAARLLKEQADRRDRWAP